MNDEDNARPTQSAADAPAPDKAAEKSPHIPLDVSQSIWERVFTVAPLVLVGTREEDGSFNLAPKHMAFPLGWGNHFGFVCTPRHSTYQNIRREQAFTVSFPRPSQILLTSLAAGPRESDCAKPSLKALPMVQAREVEGVLVEDATLCLECRLEQIIDGFGDNSIIAGRILAASAREDALRRAGEDDGQLIFDMSLLAYLHPGRFAVIEHSHAFPFPEDFQR
ncbi:MAG TPA: flavin reductase [Acidobacteriota bacterium]|nr:flavin reductase [Acidobacteriota bacterium]